MQYFFSRSPVFHGCLLQDPFSLSFVFFRTHWVSLWFWVKDFPLETSTHPLFHYLPNLWIISVHDFQYSHIYAQAFVLFLMISTNPCMSSGRFLYQMKTTKMNTLYSHTQMYIVVYALLSGKDSDENMGNCLDRSPWPQFPPNRGKTAPSFFAVIS